MISQPERGFAGVEFENRLARAQTLMAERNLDGLLVMTEPEVRYFSGFLTQFWRSPTRPWFLIIPASGKPVAVVPEIGGALMRQTWLDDVRTWGSPHPTDDGVSLLSEAVRELLPGEGRLGLPMGPETQIRMPLLDFERLKEDLRKIQIIDATDVVKHLRAIKSEAEIGKISYACDVASAAFEKAPDLFREGMALNEAFRRFKIECLSQGADDVSYLVGGAGQGGYKDMISPPGPTPLARGDVLMLDTGCVFDGYFCDFDRNFAIGFADDEARRIHQVLWQATEAGLAAARPGATCADLFHAMNKIIKEHGGGEGDVGRFGHGLGMQLTEGPSHAPFDKTVLEAGMVITLEPGTNIGSDRIMVHEENIVIREGGPQLLSVRTPPELPVI